MGSSSLGSRVYLEHAKPLVLEDDFVVLWSRYHRIQCRIPSRWIQIRTMIGHVTLPSLVQRVMFRAMFALPNIRHRSVRIRCRYVPGTDIRRLCSRIYSIGTGQGTAFALIGEQAD